jgi:hypothetical protein
VIQGAANDNPLPAGAEQSSDEDNEPIEAANDPEAQPAADNGASNHPTDDTLLVDTPAAPEPAPAAPASEASLPAANDNSIPEALPATGTE